jgi:hypothetical protein
MGPANAELVKTIRRDKKSSRTTRQNVRKQENGLFIGEMCCYHVYVLQSSLNYQAKAAESLSFSINDKHRFIVLTTWRAYTRFA